MSRICRDDEEELVERIGVFICHCGENIAKTVDIDEVLDYVKTLPDVVFAREYMFMCSKQGTDLIQEAIRSMESLAQLSHPVHMNSTGRHLLMP